MEIVDSLNVILSDNLFQIDTDGLLYDADAEDIGFLQHVAVGFDSCHDVSITDNIFTYSVRISVLEIGIAVDSSAPWIYFANNVEASCLSGNMLSLHVFRDFTLFVVCTYTMLT